MRVPLAFALLALFRLGANAQQSSPLVYSTFFGEANPVAVEADARGAAWVFGYTRSEGLPTTPNAFQPERNRTICFSIGLGPAPSQIFPCGDLFVAKMNPEGTAFDYFSYIGGDGVDSAGDLALAPDGSAFLLASTSGDMPTTAGVLSREEDSSNVWVAKLAPDGAFVWATYLRGVSGSPAAIEIASDGTAWIAGETRSATLPATADALQGVSTDRPDSFGSGDGYLARLSADGSRLLYATYFGGSNEDAITDLAIAPNGDLVTSGYTRSADFPVTSGSLQTVFPAADREKTSFVARIAGDGSRLLYSTFLGGSESYQAPQVAVDAAGNAIVAGMRDSGDFPFTEGALRTGSEGFLAKLDPEGSRLLYAADVGGYEPRLAVDDEGNALLAARAIPESMPPTAGAIQRCGAASEFSPLAAVAAKIDPTGSKVLYSTFLSPSLSVPPPMIAPGLGGSFFVAGSSYGRALPDTNPSAPHHRDEGAFLARIDPSGRRRDLHASLIRSSASYAGGAVAPGEWVAVFSPPLGPDSPAIAQLDETGRPPEELAGLRVLFDGVPARLTYAHGCQVNAIAPFALQGKSETEVVVEYLGERSNSVRLPVSETAPGLFSDDATGLGEAAALNQDLTVNSALNLALKGSVVALYGTGAGRFEPALGDGEIPPGAPPSIAAETKALVWDGAGRWIEAEVTYAGAAPGLVAGLAQINFRIPAEVIVPRNVLFSEPVQVKWVAGGRESRPLGVWVKP